ncbi:SiaB family protein kinase [uncultured Microscilla sp.]|uniref:SiaB family protein kinase n=1 Tax=uncultured Microscilla sp. TaxID=432653 RepID=UPI002613000F|nr:SiaB family protein kinase [uncultured Microscilla sp.]
MLLDDLRNLRKTVASESILFSYRGEITQELMVYFLRIVDKKLIGSKESPLIRRRILNIMIESLQNAVKHARDWYNESEIEPENEAIFLLSRRDDKYLLINGNAVKNDVKPFIERKIENINSLSSDKQRKLFRNIIKYGVYGSKGGAGLGFVDMARKSGDLINFDFEEIDEKYSYFTYLITLDRNSIPEPDLTPKPNSVSTV